VFSTNLLTKKEYRDPSKNLTAVLTSFGSISTVPFKLANIISAGPTLPCGRGTMEKMVKQYLKTGRKRNPITKKER
jgi:hypothetical protein